MDLLHIVALAIVQGVTAFLPIGSEAHVALLQRWFPGGEPGPGVVMALHLGGVLAVAAYFRAELWATAVGVYHLIKGRSTENSRLAVKLFVGSAPMLAIAIAAMALGLTPDLKNVRLIAWTMFGFGLLLLLADRLGMTLRRIEHMGSGTALVIGMAQAMALAPGAGRVGLAITAARLFGFERGDAARFAMLIGILPLLAVAAWDSWSAARAGTFAADSDAAVAGFVAFLAALGAIAFLMQWLRRGTLTPFALYRLIVGGALLYSLYT